jgi:hypothetical protein
MRPTFAAGALILLALGVGCGGSGGGSSSGGSLIPTSPPAPPLGSAKFTVNTETNEVTVETLGETGRAAFNGGAVSFTHSTLLSEGSPERRVIRATVKNNTQEAIGSNASGFRLIFSSFQNEALPATTKTSTVRTTTLFGSTSGSNADGPFATAGILQPQAIIAADSQDTLFLVDGSGRLRIADQGVLSTAYAGSVTLGPVLAKQTDSAFLGTSGASIQGISRSGAGATVGPLAGSASAAGAVDGNFSAARFSISIADISPAPGSAGDNINAVVADGVRARSISRPTLGSPGSVTTLFVNGSPLKGIHHAGSFFLCSTENTIIVRELSSAADARSAVLGSTAGFANGAGGSARFNNPTKFAKVGDAIYVTDQGNHAIRQLLLRPGANPFSASSWHVATISGNGTPGVNDGTGTMTHNGPASIAAGNGEALYVAELGSNLIRKIVPMFDRFDVGLATGGSTVIDPVTLANSDSAAPSSPERTPIISETGSVGAGLSKLLKAWQFIIPEGVRTFSFVVTLEAETDSLATLPSVSIPGSTGSGSSQVSVRGFAGSAGGFADGSLERAAFGEALTGICMAADGTMFISDGVNNAIRRISKDGRVTTIAGSPADTTSLDGTFGSGTVSTPLGIACNPEGTEIYFTQSNHVVRKVVFVPSKFVNGSSINLDPAEKSSYDLETMAGLAGNSGTTDNVRGSAARFNTPRQVVYVSPTTLYVGDLGVRIRVISRGSGIPESPDAYSVGTLAGGTTSGQVDSAVGSSVRFQSIQGMALAPDGSLYVVDNGSDRIRKVLPGGSTTTFAGTVAGFADSPSGSVGSPRFNFLQGVAVDGAGYVYVSDFGNSLIRRISPAGRVSTVAGATSTTGLTDGRGDQARFSTPRMMVSSKGGDLYLLDGPRVRLIQRIINQ